MPNTDPLTVSAETLADKVKRGHHRMHCDFAFFVGATVDNTKHLPELERLPGCAGIKVFMGSSTGSLLVADDAGLRAVLQKIRRRASFHAEDEPRLNERKNLRVEGDPRSHPVWRDEVAALKATQRLVTIAHETGARVHVLHISTAQEMEYLAGHKDVASVETTPHHLTLEAPGCYERLGTRAQMNPPVRDAVHRAGIWTGLNEWRRRCARLRPRPAHSRRKSQNLSSKPVGDDWCADARSDHAGSRQCRSSDAAAVCRSDKRRSGASFRHCLQRPDCGRLRRGCDD